MSAGTSSLDTAVQRADASLTSRLLPSLFRVAIAGCLTALLVLTLIGIRLFDGLRVPDREIRTMETLEVSLPAPPPPPPENPPEAPPPPPPKLPQLQVRLDSVAPPLKASPKPQLDLTMTTADFELEADPIVVVPKPAPKRTVKPTPPAPPQRSTYSASELDARPRLLNRPRASYPASQLRRGVREGRVLLEVAIDTRGSVTVRRILSSSHADFSEMARSFAARARFSVPTKDGRPVVAIYRWPLILRP